jgi:hypothetical protein
VRLLPAFVAVLLAITGAHAQESGGQLDELVAKGWEPFSGKLEPNHPFTTRDHRSLNLNAYAVFLRRKGGLAYCVKVVDGTLPYGFCEIIVGKD